MTDQEKTEKAEAKRKRDEAAKARDALAAALKTLDTALNTLPWLLLTYEATGDHDHGKGRIPVGAPCPGGDCLVAKARHFIQVALR